MVCEDYRIGGELRYYFGSPTETMRIPDEILKCVVYLYFQEKDEPDEERRAIGTAFFVGIRSKTAERVYPYLVTAKHCVAEPMERGTIFVRINTVDGSSAYVEIAAGWIFPSDPSSDIAVLPFSIPSHIYERFDFRGIAERMFATTEKQKEHEVGIGDDIIISGLFTRLGQRPVNVPIVRFGNIAAMPIDRVADTKTGLDYCALLAEVRSIGGLSGSPVFVYLGPERIPPSKTRRPDRRFLMLIGVVRAHWEHKEAGIALKGSAFADELDKVNWGIAAITPVADLLSVLYGDELMEKRKAADRECRMEDAATNDSTFVGDAKTCQREPMQTTPEGAKIPIPTKEQFFDTLKKASRRVKPD